MRWGDYSWQRASDRRDYMIDRERRDYPDDSSHARGHEKAGITVIRGTAKIAGQGRVDVTADGRVRSLEAKAIVAQDVYAVGDVIGREISTHLGHYEGELAVRMALGDDITPDLRPVPRCVYTEPELAAVGLRLDQAEQAGHDALEVTDDLATTAKGYVAEAEGHVTVVVDRRERVLLGAFIAGPGAAEAIHEAVLAIKLRVALPVLEDTIHAFPTTSRALWWVIARASRELDPRTAS